MAMRKRKEKGMTLIEVVLTLMLSSLFFCCVLQFMATGTNFYARTKEMQQLRLAMNKVKLFIEEQYQEATQVCIYILNDDFQVQSTIDCVHDEHNMVPMGKEDYTNEYLSHIAYKIPEESEEPNKKEVIDMIAKEVNGEKVFKITFQGQTLINNYLKIMVNYKNRQAILSITIFGDRGKTLEDTLKLDLRYKL